MVRRNFCHAILIILVCVLTFSCSSFQAGPDLPVDVQIVSLRPTTGNSERCCCQVIGTATNRGTESVHVTIKFAAFAGPTQSESFASILYFIKDLSPNETRVIDASGFLVSCSAISRLEIKDIDVTGIWFPDK